MNNGAENKKKDNITQNVILFWYFPKYFQFGTIIRTGFHDLVLKKPISYLILSSAAPPLFESLF